MPHQILCDYLEDKGIDTRLLRSYSPDINIWSDVIMTFNARFRGNLGCGLGNGWGDGYCSFSTLHGDGFGGGYSRIPSLENFQNDTTSDILRPAWGTRELIQDFLEHKKLKALL